MKEGKDLTNLKENKPNAGVMNFSREMAECAYTWWSRLEVLKLGIDSVVERYLA